MALNPDKVFGDAAFGEYGLLDRLKIRIISRVFNTLIRVIGCTLRFEVENEEGVEEALVDGRLPIYCFWHDRIVASTYYFRNRDIIVMTSQSFDGECIARTIVGLGYGAARGSSSRGGVGALIEMIRFMKDGYPCAFTIDGPRGPRYEAKPGPCILAKKTGNPLIPFSIETESFWSLKSWDRLQIPKPFSKARLIFGAPIFLKSDATDDEIEEARMELQSDLLDLVRAGEDWRAVAND
jgi:lysophospholipid acyltransferase (LPLAT)-like uncharacterized protein